MKFYCSTESIKYKHNANPQIEMADIVLKLGQTMIIQTYHIAPKNDAVNNEPNNEVYNFPMWKSYSYSNHNEITTTKKNVSH